MAPEANKADTSRRSCCWTRSTTRHSIRRRSSGCTTGRVYTRPVDGSATLTAQPLPDGQGIVVLQSADRFGSDNVVVLSPSGEIRARITNPYRDSNFFVPGDSCCFDSIGVGGGKIVLGIQVRRHLQGKPRDALPLYEAHYDPATLKLTKLEWVPWT